MEIELSTGAVKDYGSAIVGAGGFFGSGESAEPFARAFSRLSDLSHPLSPAALADAAVAELGVVGTAFTSADLSAAAAASAAGRTIGVGIRVLFYWRGLARGRIHGERR